MRAIVYLWPFYLTISLWLIKAYFCVNLGPELGWIQIIVSLIWLCTVF